MRHQWDCKWLTGAFALLGAALVFVIGCGARPLTQVPPEIVASSGNVARKAITIGDIDPDNPTKKIELYQPLADYLAAHLKEFGIEEGRVVIARDIQGMAGFLRDGTVDIYLGSPFPTLSARNLSGAEVILRGWRENTPVYWSLYIARRDSGMTSIQDLLGKVIAFKNPYSTSGFALPAGSLMQRGFNLKMVGGARARVASDEIGYLFSQDAEDTVELTLRGVVAGGAVSNRDYEKIPSEVRQHLVILDRTMAVPIELVSVRLGLQSELVDSIRGHLLGMDQTEEGLRVLKNLENTARFDALPHDAEISLVEFSSLMTLLLR